MGTHVSAFPSFSVPTELFLGDGVLPLPQKNMMVALLKRKIIQALQPDGVLIDDTE